MKKIGIITIVKVNNYGAELQAFALQQKLNDLGYNAELIDFLYYKHKNYERTSLSKPWIKLGVKKKIQELIYPLIIKIKTIKYLKPSKERNKKFDLYHKNHTHFSNRCFNSIDKLFKEKWNYDVFMVGSDQVWNPTSYTSLDPYVLNFAPKNAITVSYASSFGVKCLPPETIYRFKNSLSKFSAIGVREIDGKRIIEQQLGLEARVVLDPTLLLDRERWLLYAKVQKIEPNYLLLYMLSKSDIAIKLAEKIAKLKGYKIIRICKEAAPPDNSKKIENVLDAGPAEFLGLFMNASFVITNSFHGTAFSVNFERPFYTVINNRKMNNSRQLSLLKSLKLENRIITKPSDFSEIHVTDCDFTKSIVKLNELRKQSINFLFESIN
ncbi:polysaccharide pyruvyl transferase family protein [Saccharicrinis sp. FJH54]|uniref:polysaccharide pyruvyl transferase family protein n=1 Tax=Saccharicrinis sp. FJH54 TaxID=3344665 RepID=UPI0035D3E83A